MGNFITSAKRYTFDAEFTVAGVISVIAEDEIAWDFDGRPELKLLDEVT